LIPATAFATGLGALTLAVIPPEESQDMERIDGVDCPFVDNPGYMKGGRKFLHPMKDKSGREFSMTDLAGNVVILVFYTIWCPNCPQVLKSIDNLNMRLNVLGVGGVKILAFNIGDESVELLEAHNKTIDIQTLAVHQSIPSSIIREIKCVPACLIFDKKTNPVCGYLGEVDYASEEFFSFVEKLVK
jgi:thiol-disulfide isomerase/thioredoxin